MLVWSGPSSLALTAACAVLYLWSYRTPSSEPGNTRTRPRRPALTSSSRTSAPTPRSETTGCTTWGAPAEWLNLAQCRSHDAIFHGAIVCRLLLDTGEQALSFCPCLQFDLRLLRTEQALASACLLFYPCLYLTFHFGLIQLSFYRFPLLFCLCSLVTSGPVRLELLVTHPCLSFATSIAGLSAV